MSDVGSQISTVRKFEAAGFFEFGSWTVDFKLVFPNPLGVASHGGHSEFSVFYTQSNFLSASEAQDHKPFSDTKLTSKLPRNPKYTRNVEEVTRKFPVLARPECFPLILVTRVKCSMQDSK